MKITVTILAALALATTAFSAEYTLFRVCEDQHIIRTSDGAEAGHVEYIIVEPTGQRIVSTVVTGGVLGERFVAVPFVSMRFGAEREIVLNEITRERLVSAPVIERTQIVSKTAVEPAIFERASTHFGVRADVRGTTSTRTSTRSDVNVREGQRPDAETPGRTATEPARERNANQPGRREAAETTTPPAQESDAARRRAGREAERREIEKRETGKATEKPAREAEKATPEKSERNADKPERTPEKSERNAEKPTRTPEKAERNADKPDQTTSDRPPGNAPEKATDKSEPSRDKPPGTPDREAGKPEGKPDQNPPTPEKEKRTPQ